MAYISGRNPDVHWLRVRVLLELHGNRNDVTYTLGNSPFPKGFFSRINSLLPQVEVNWQALLFRTASSRAESDYRIRSSRSWGNAPCRIARDKDQGLLSRSTIALSLACDCG